VIARLTPAGKIRQRVMLAPHMDTVGQPNIDALLKPKRVGGRIVGRGACDTKGCVTAMLLAACRVASGGRRPASTEILFTGLIDEECDQLGSRHYAAHGDKADLAIVGEPTKLEVITAHKGDIWIQLTTHGRAAHGSTPHLGINAAHEAAKVIEVLLGEYTESLRKRTHPLLGRASINVGAVHAGTQPNIVPDLCTIMVDRRTLPGEEDERVVRNLGTLLKRRGLKAKLTYIRTAPCLPLQTDPNLPLVRALCKAAGRKRTLGVNYFCDAAHLAAGGIKSIVFGPGDIAHAHTSNESISVANLEKGVRILESFLRNLD
jgi:acetylornithine deacetylase/succinyl-diaminopimelate desuccinylase-like protein